MMRNSTMYRAVAVVALSLAPAAVLAGGDWNDAQIEWKTYEEGLEAASASGKPICMVFYTEWCPHCTNYAKVFHDAEVVERSKDFVMVRLNKDRNAELSAKFAPDGQYIPRTYFLKPDGSLDESIHAPREKFKYFYHENEPSSLLGGMQRAKAKLATGQGG